MNVALDARGLPVGYPYKPDLEVTPREARAMGASALIVDVREPGEHACSCVPGSILIPLGEVTARAEEVRSRAESGARVLTLCHHGVRSIKAALALRRAGIEASSIAGGIELWSLAVDPSVKRYTREGTVCRVV